MRRYAMYLGYAYAIYVTVNLVLFFMRNPPPASHGRERSSGLVYIVIALGASAPAPRYFFSRRKAELTRQRYGYRRPTTPARTTPSRLASETHAR